MLYNKEWKEGLNLDKPSLKALSFLLRHEELWPRNFTWSYYNCHKCAMGLANRLWNTYFGNPLAQTFNVDIQTIDGLFYGGYFIDYPGVITPEAVADQIDKVLAREKEVINAV